jgi:biopolymer transport protein ExbB
VLTLLAEQWEKLQVFMESGGDVLVVIFAVTLLMWMLILERYLYLRVTYPKHLRRAAASWKARKERSSWDAEQIRQLQISDLYLRLNSSLPMIKTLVAVCPLLGLLGTVTGMIEVFEIMAMVGSGNARAMASGVYMATIPTMSGMVAALSGLYFSVRLERLARQKIAQAEDTLALQRGETCAVA